MRRAPQIVLEPEERRTLEHWAGERSASARRARRSRIVLGAALGRTNAEIAADLATHPETVARWRARFALHRLDGVDREAPRSGDPRRVPPATVERILGASSDPSSAPPGGWSTRGLARTLQVNHMLVHRVWKAYGFGERWGPDADRSSPVVEVVGGIVHPHVRAVVFGTTPNAGAGGARDPSDVPPSDVDVGELVESPQARAAGVVRALRRLGARGTGSSSRRGSSASLLVFLRGLERSRPSTERLDVVLDRTVAHLSPRVRDWLANHPRFRLYPADRGRSWAKTTASWLARWDSPGLDRSSFRHAREFDRAISSLTSGHGKPSPRLVWRPSPPRGVTSI